LIRTEGERGAEIRRKDIERAMRRWFEIKSSAISKLIRSLARPPLDLVEIFEDAHSGREKRVRLTAKGHAEIDRIFAAGRDFIASMVEHLSAKVRQGRRSLPGPGLADHRGRRLRPHPLV